MRAVRPSTRRRLAWLPSAPVGWAAIVLFAVSAGAVLFMGATAAAQQPATFDHDSLLGLPAAMAAACGVASTGLGGYAVLRGERAMLLFLVLAAELNIVAYVIGEAIRRT